MLIGAAGEVPAWLAEAAPVGSRVTCCPTVAGTRAILASGEPIIVLTPICDANDDDAVPVVEHAVRRAPWAAVVGMISRRYGRPEDFLRLARSGVHALLFDEDQGTPLLVRRTLLEAATRCRSQTVWSDVAPITPDRVRPIVAYGLRHGHESLTVDATARALGLHRKTLAERCLLSRSLPPQLMLGWCRMMAAAVLLEDRGRLVDHIALELDFASGTAFRNQLKRYTGFAPNELRSRGPIAEMTRQFRRAIAHGDVRDHVGRVG